jgi:hypothetical protein
MVIETILVELVRLVRLVRDDLSVGMQLKMAQQGRLAMLELGLEQQQRREKSSPGLEKRQPGRR